MIAKMLGSDLGGTFDCQGLSIKFTQKRKDLLRFIFKQVAIHNRAFPSHETMVKVTGLSRSAVIRALKLFEQLQLIDIDHRNLIHKTNIYSLGAVFRNATAVRYLSGVFKVLVPAFCRTMERLGNLMFAKKPEEVYTGYFKSNATLSLRDVFVFPNTNTNTSLYIDRSRSKKKSECKMYKNDNEVRDSFRHIGDPGSFSARSKQDPRYATKEAREATHNKWVKRKYNVEYKVIDKPDYIASYEEIQEYYLSKNTGIEKKDIKKQEIPVLPKLSKEEEHQQRLQQNEKDIELFSKELEKASDDQAMFLKILLNLA